MEFCKKLIASCLVGRGRSTIAVLLVMLIGFGLIALVVLPLFLGGERESADKKEHPPT